MDEKLTDDEIRDFASCDVQCDRCKAVGKCSRMGWADILKMFATEIFAARDQRDKALAKIQITK